MPIPLTLIEGVRKFFIYECFFEREPGAGSREPGAGSREPGAGSREPGAGSREPGAGSREPGAGSREPGAGSREPGAGSREPGAGSREPGAGSREPGLGGVLLHSFCSKNNNKIYAIYEIRTIGFARDMRFLKGEVLWPRKERFI